MKKIGPGLVGNIDKRDKEYPSVLTDVTNSTTCEPFHRDLLQSNAFSEHSTATSTAKNALEKYHNNFEVVAGPGPMESKGAAALALETRIAYKKQIDNAARKERLVVEIEVAQKKLKKVGLAILVVSLVSVLFLFLTLTSS